MNVNGRRTAPRRALVKEDLVRLALGEEFWTATPDRVPESVREIIVNYLRRMELMAEKNVGLILHGDEGVGKTAIAALILMEARAIQLSGFYTTVWGMREKIRNRVPFDEEQGIMARALDVSVLVLDDLRAEDLTDNGWFGRSDIEGLVAERSSRRRMTLITTRMTDKALGEKAPRLLGILQGRAVALEVKGPDQREHRDDAVARKLIHSF